MSRPEHDYSPAQIRHSATRMNTGDRTTYPQVQAILAVVESIDALVEKVGNLVDGVNDLVRELKEFPR
jgi:hypothetical protein